MPMEGTQDHPHLGLFKLSICSSSRYYPMLKNIAPQGQRRWITCFLKADREIKLSPPILLGQSWECHSPSNGTQPGVWKKRHRQYWGAEDLCCLGRSAIRTPHWYFGVSLGICLPDHSIGIHHISSAWLFS